MTISDVLVEIWFGLGVLAILIWRFRLDEKSKRKGDKKAGVIGLTTFIVLLIILGPTSFLFLNMPTYPIVHSPD